MNNQYDRNSGDLIPVEGKLGLYRDPNNLAIVNKNNVEYESYITRRKFMQKKEEKIENINEEVSSLKQEVDFVKNDLTEIKELLKDLIKKI